MNLENAREDEQEMRKINEPLYTFCSSLKSVE